MKKVLAIALALTFLLSAAAFAGMNYEHKVAVHIDVHASRTCTKNFYVYTGCGSINVTWETCVDIDVFPVFFDLTAVTGIEYGLTWPVEWYSCAYTKCAGDFQIGDIVWPGNGAAHTWSVCQYVDNVVAGYGWLWAGTPGMVCPVPNSTTGFIGTSDCATPKEADDPMCIFCSGACGMVGDDPCAPTGTEQSTWGEIKGMFR
jgi:hypothetical protein